MNANQVIELLDQAEELKPVIDQYAAKILSLGSVAKTLLQPAAIAIADIRADAFHHYVSRGLTREEALQMCAADIRNLRDIKRK